MNERIKELMDEAVRFRLDPDSKQYEAQVSPEDLEVFAELIVRDCMDVVDGYTKPRTFDTHYDAVEQIEALFGIKHNGVEE
jgi:hypothetical protein